MEKLDESFRSPESVIVKALKVVAPLEGDAYLNSRQKRQFDMIVSGMASLVAVPLTGVLAGIKYIEDGQNPFFVQDRVRSDGEKIKVVKIRSMVTGAEKVENNWAYAEGKNPDEDPRNTRFGKWMRKSNIDELPQLIQVLVGEMSLVGNRALPREDYLKMKSGLSPESSNQFSKDYSEAQIGLFGVKQVLNHKKSLAGTRICNHFYREHASLGMDVYILWRFLKGLIAK